MKTSSAPASTPVAAPAPSRRRFDRDEALDAAMRLFWQHGYEATSMAELLKAMGLTAPSLYAAFGNKEQLFREAVQRYSAIYGPRIFGPFAEAIPARDAVEQVLKNAAAHGSSSKHPGGCFVTCGAMNCSEDAAGTARFLRDLRRENERHFEERLMRAAHDGELPPATEPKRLAKYFFAVMTGIQLQSLDGASKRELEAVASDAMAAWPAD